MINYDKIYNSPESNKKVDQSWERYSQPINLSDMTPGRYKYSVSKLYGSVLDVGAGDGFGAYLMTKIPTITDITCLEVQSTAIKKMQQHISKFENIKIIQGAIEYIDLQKKFDSIHCGHTLEHVEDLQATMIGLQRHCKDRIVISVPIHGGVNGMHLREFNSEEQVIALVEKYFHVIECSTFKKDIKVYSLVIIGRV